MAHTIIKRVGGKYKLRRWIASLLPKHNIYVEPFGGSFAVGLTMPEANGSKYRKVFNDLDCHLANFFQVLRDSPDDLIRAVSLTPYGRCDFESAVEYIRSNIDFSQEDPVEWARNFLIYNRQSMFGKETGNWYISRQGENIAHTWSNLPPDLEFVAKQFRGVFIENKDYQDLTKQWDGEQTVFYFDPPYLDVEKDFYAVNKEDGFDHTELAKTVKNLTGSWAISYYDSPQIRDLYQGCRFETIEVNKHMQTSDKKDKATELLVIKENDWAKQNRQISDCFD